MQIEFFLLSRFTTPLDNVLPMTTGGAKMESKSIIFDGGAGALD